MRRLPAMAALSLALAAPAAGGAQYLFTQDPCGSPAAQVSLFKQVGSDVLENLGFDGLGGMWVSNSSQEGGRIEKYDRFGQRLMTVPVPSPGAITLGPDGAMYVNSGNSAAGALFRTGASKVLRFDPADLSQPPGTVASGFNMANGAVFDDSGHIYVSNDFDKALIRIDLASGMRTTWADVYGTNGLVFRPSQSGGDIYAAITFDQRSPIEKIPVANPAAHTTFTELSFGALSLEPGVHPPQQVLPPAPLLGVKGLDDMTTDGTHLYVVANGTGELLRVKLSDGSACLLAGGLRNPSSVRFEQGFDGTGDLFITEFSGAIRRVHLS